MSRTRDQSPQQFFVNLTAQTSDEYNQINQNTGTAAYPRLPAIRPLWSRPRIPTRDLHDPPEEPSGLWQCMASSTGFPLWLQHQSDGLLCPFGHQYRHHRMESLSFSQWTRQILGPKLNYALPKLARLFRICLWQYDKFFHSSVVVDVPVVPIADVRSRPLCVTGALRQTWGSVGAMSSIPATSPEAKE